MNYRTETKTVYIADDNFSFDNESHALAYCLRERLKSMIGNSQAETIIYCLRRNGSLTKMFSDFIASLDEPEVKQMEDEWIEWRGGELPINPETPVDVRFGGGCNVCYVEAKTLYWGWINNGGLGDIVAYRVVCD